MSKSLDKISTLILRYIPFVLALITPLFFLPITSDPFTFNKFYLVTSLASLSLIAWCVRSLVRGKLSLTLSPALLPLAILALTQVISSLWLSPIKHASLFGQTAFYISLLVLFFTTTSSQKTRDVVNTVIFGLILSVSLLSLFTILHYFGIVGRLTSSDLINNKFFNPTGGVLVAFTFSIPVLLATVGYLIVTKNWLQKSLLFASTILTIVASLINLSIIFPQSGQQVIFMLPYNASWSIAVDIFKNWQTALFGAGPDTYLSVFTRLRPGYLNANPTLWALRFPESSSYFLTLLTTIGLIGSLAFMASFLRLAVVSLKNKNTQTGNPGYIFLTVLIITTLLTYIFTPASVATLVLGIVSLIALTLEMKVLGQNSIHDVSFSLSAKSEPETFYQNLPDEHRLSPYSVVLPWVATLVSVVFLSLYWVYAVPAYQASMEIKSAGEMISTNPVGAYLKEVNAAKLDPYNSTYPTLLSQFFKNASLSLLNKKDATAEDKKNATDFLQRSIDYGKQAASLNPYSVIAWENLADIYQSFIGVAEGSESFAVSHMAQAISLDPTNPELRLKLGVLFFKLGDSDQAVKLVSQAIELKQNWEIPYYNLALIYREKKDYARGLQYLKAGLQYVDQNSDTYFKFQQEIASTEKLVGSNTATSSATTK